MAANSKAIQRSMRAVAIDEFLNFEEGLGYERQDLLDLGYFETANVNDEKTGSLVGKSLSFSMPEYPALNDGESLVAFVGAEKVNVVYNADSATFVGKTTFFTPIGTKYVTLFDDNNFAYITKVDVQKAIPEIGGSNDVEFDVGDFFPNHQHVLGEWEALNIASCVEEGKYVKRCLICKKVVESTAVPKTAHKSGDWQIIVQADCLSDGEQIKTCQDCGTVVERIIIEKSAHSQSEWRVEKEPTCDKMGIRVKTCNSCNKTIASEPIPTIPHTEGEWAETRGATCSQEGIREKKCTVCETLLQTEIIQKTEHTLGEWEIDLVATCVKAGREIQKCTVCGELVNSKAISATGVFVASVWSIVALPI
jgi:hypothetical protein